MLYRQPLLGIRHAGGGLGAPYPGHNVGNAQPACGSREGEPDADFINIVAFGKRAEFAGKYFRKGMMVAVVGELRISSYEDRDGNKRWSTDVVVSEQYFADGKASSNEDRSRDFAPKQEKKFTAPSPVEGFEAIDEDEDLPF